MDTEEPLTRLVKQEKAYMTNSRVTKEMESAGEESEDGGQYFNPDLLQGHPWQIVINVNQYNIFQKVTSDEFQKIIWLSAVSQG